MRAGRLNKLVTFQRESTSDDGGGGQVVTWVNITGLVRISASFTPERGRERLEAGRLESAVAGVLRMRSFTLARTITEKDRVMIDDIPHIIRAIVNPDGRNEQLEMTIERGAA